MIHQNKQSITIREYTEADADILWQLFFDTIRRVTSRDYSISQVIAWAPEHYDATQWSLRMADISPYIAQIDEQIVGYADRQSDGLIDHFFCHHQYQGCGVGKALMMHIIATAIHDELSCLYSNVSITAKPFFEHFGFIVVEKHRVEVRGQYLTNFLMKKQMS